jgi:hypothetical protein
MMRLRYPIERPAGRLLRVLICARYSTDEQHPTSIADQICYCREFLRINGVDDAEIVEVSDAEMSGELVNRPGINEARRRIDARWPDLYLSEDCGRLFRHETACGEHLETAVDLGIRYIGINDDVDTAEEDWDDRLREAMRHHARSNKYTAKRIKRKLEGLWRLGAAIGLLRPGYRRKPSVPASDHEPEKGPFFDEIDPTWAPVIHEAYERVTRRDPPWLVGRRLTEQGLPKCSNGMSNVWTDRNVIALIKRTIYRGHDQYRVTVVRKQHRSGKHLQIRNDAELVLTREMPHLKIVSDALWHAANEAIRERNLRGEAATGRDHPLTGVPRDSRGPLAGLFVCGAAGCGAKMHREGGPVAGYRAYYRCGRASNHDCWNKATARTDLVHERIGRAVVEKLLSLDGVLDAFLENAQRLFLDDGPRQAERAELEAQIREREKACQRLIDLAEQGAEAAPILLERLQQRRGELVVLRAKQEALTAQPLAGPPPTKEEILAKIEVIRGQLLAMDHEAGVELKRLVSPIRAVPYRQSGGNKVVLRAAFELRLAALLPEQILAALRGTSTGALAGGLHLIPMTVELFERSSGPEHFAQALELSRAGLTLEEIGRRLGIAKRQAHIAVQYGKDLEAAGLTDPYLELTAPPSAASRWRTGRRLSEGGSKGPDSLPQT